MPYPRTRVLVAWVSAATVAAVLAILSHARTEPESEDIAETLLRGIEHRASVVHSLAGVAQKDYTFSSRKTSDKQQTVLQDASRTQYPGEVRAVDRMHASLLDFSFDFAEGQWRCEEVDITNSGHSLWASTRYPALNRHIPPEYFYNSSFSDGHKVYTYDRSRRAGTIAAYTGVPAERPRPLHWIDGFVLKGVPAAVRERFRAGEYHALFLGSQELAGQSCQKVLFRGTPLNAPRRMIARLWVAPGLGFATVRSETFYVDVPASPEDQPSLSTARIVEARDFTKLTAGLWAPLTVEINSFNSAQGEGLEAWKYTVVIRCRSLTANGPVDGVTVPYPFPFDTNVLDRDTGEERHGPWTRDPAPAAPDPFGLALTPEVALSMLDAAAGSESP